MCIRVVTSMILFSVPPVACDAMPNVNHDVQAARKKWFWSTSCYASDTTVINKNVRSDFPYIACFVWNFEYIRWHSIWLIRQNIINVIIFSIIAQQINRWSEQCTICNLQSLPWSNAVPIPKRIQHIVDCIPTYYQLNFNVNVELCNEHGGPSWCDAGFALFGLHRPMDRPFAVYWHDVGDSKLALACIINSWERWTAAGRCKLK